MQRHTTAISQTSTHPPPHLPCQPHRLYCVFFFCWRETHCFLMLMQCWRLQKWALVDIAVSDVASCLAVLVRLSLHVVFCLFAFFFFVSFSLSVQFFVSLWFSFCSVLVLIYYYFLFLSFLGVTEPRLSELSVCYRTVHLLIAMADCTN